MHNTGTMSYRRPRSNGVHKSRGKQSVTMGLLRRQQGLGNRGQHGLPGQFLAELALDLVSPSAFPCPESSPAFSLQFSRQAGDGHFLAFGTEWGMLTIVDTRVEATVQRDQNGPVGSGALSSTTNLHGNSTSNHNIRTGRCPPTTTSRRGPHSPMTSYGGRGVGQPAVLAEWKALRNCVFDLEWMKGDSLIALGCGDTRSRVHDVETQTEVCSFSGHKGSVKSVSANPVEQSVLLTGSRDGSFALWDTRLLHRDGPNAQGRHGTAAEHCVSIENTFAEDPQSPTLLPVEQVIDAHAQGDSKRKRARSLTHEAPTPSFVGEGPGRGGGAKSGRGTPYWGTSNYTVTSVEWMGDGEKFITGGQDGLVKLWDTRYARRPLVELRPNLPSRREMTSSAHAYDNSSSPRLRRIPPFLQETFSTAVSHTLGGGTAYAKEAFSAGGAGQALGAMRAGMTSATGGRRKSGGNGRWGGEGRIRGGDVVGRQAAESGRPYGVSSVHACEHGSRVAVCTVKNQVSVYTYSLGTLLPLGTYQGNDNISSYYIKAKLSPDGTMLASGSPNDAVCLWEVDSPGEPLARLQGHVNEVTAVDWCRSENLKLASCSDDETVRLWTLDAASRARSRHAPQRPTAAKVGLLRDGSSRVAPVAQQGQSPQERRSDEASSVPDSPIVDQISADIPKSKFGAGRAYVGESARWKISSQRCPRNCEADIAKTLDTAAPMDIELGSLDVVEMGAGPGESLEGPPIERAIADGLLPMNPIVPRLSAASQYSVGTPPTKFSARGTNCRSPKPVTPANAHGNLGGLRGTENGGIDHLEGARGGNIDSSSPASDLQASNRLTAVDSTDDENADPCPPTAITASHLPGEGRGPSGQEGYSVTTSHNAHNNNIDNAAAVPSGQHSLNLLPPSQPISPANEQSSKAQIVASSLHAVEGTPLRKAAGGPTGCWTPVGSRGKSRTVGRAEGQRFRGSRLKSGSGLSRGVEASGRGGCVEVGQTSLMAFWKRDQGLSVNKDGDSDVKPRGGFRSSVR